MNNQLIIRSPSPNPVKIFLAGGISNCPDWQTFASEIFKEELSGIPHILYNPRRDDFDITKKEMSYNQIVWEHERLSQSHIVFFWFPKDALCPITLFELGKVGMSKTKIIVGCDPDYQRRFDVETQLELLRPTTKVYTSLRDTVIVASNYVKDSLDKL